MLKTMPFLLLIFSLQGHAAAIDPVNRQKLEQIIAGEQRSAEHKKRDLYRHPEETLTFFGIKDTQTVVEIWPGEGWYTEILGPFLQAHGKLYEASYSANSKVAYQRKAVATLQQKLIASPDLYSSTVLTELELPDAASIAPENSADLVLSFRNVHNWLKEGNADAVFAALFKALKPGGVLGIVEHRAKPDTSLQQSIATGYVTEAEVVRLAEAAGFQLTEKSEINANPNDSKDYANGVWTLPPTLKGVDDSNKQRYLSIGESDRMTLKFLKP